MRPPVLCALALVTLVAFAGEPPLCATVTGTPPAAGPDTRAEGDGQRREIAGELGTFVSVSLGIAFAYPRKWTVAEESSGIRLAGANGGVLVVEQLDGDAASENATDLPNNRCRSRTNAYGISVRTCFDTIARSTSAWFEVAAPAGKGQSFRAWTKGPAGGRAIAVVVESVRSVSGTRPQ